MLFHEFRNNCIFKNIIKRLRMILGPFESELVQMILEYGGKRKYTRNETIRFLLYDVIENEQLLKCIINYQNPRNALYVPMKFWFCHGDETVLPLHQPTEKIHYDSNITIPHTIENYHDTLAASKPASFPS